MVVFVEGVDTGMESEQGIMIISKNGSPHRSPSLKPGESGKFHVLSRSPSTSAKGRACGLRRAAHATDVPAERDAAALLHHRLEVPPRPGAGGRASSPPGAHGIALLSSMPLTACAALYLQRGAPGESEGALYLAAFATLPLEL